MLFLNVLCKWNLMSEIIWEEKGFTSSLPVHHSYILFTPTRFVETYEIYVALNASGKGRNLFSPIPPPSEEVGQNLWPRRGPSSSVTRVHHPHARFFYSCSFPILSFPQIPFHCDSMSRPSLTSLVCVEGGGVPLRTEGQSRPLVARSKGSLVSQPPSSAQTALNLQVKIHVQDMVP